MQQSLGIPVLLLIAGYFLIAECLLTRRHAAIQRRLALRGQAV